MRTRAVVVVAVVAVVAFLAACGGYEDDPSAVTQSLVGGQPPLKLPMNGVVFPQMPYPQLCPIELPSGPSMGIVMVGVGDGDDTGTHVGKFDWVLSKCLHMETGIWKDGQVQITAANGDLLFLAYEGQTYFNTWPWSGDADYVVVGGTGRFADATGSATGVMALTPVFDEQGNMLFPFPVSYDVDGIISY